MTALDAVGPHEILSRLPEALTWRVAKKAGSVVTDSGLVLRADYSVSEVESADILIVPGAGNAKSFYDDSVILNWIKMIDKKTAWTASVCTGSLILGAADLLSGLKATTHWAAMERLDKYGAFPQKSRVVQDSKYITAAGVSAGIDMALVLYAKISGEQPAKTIQLGIEYDPNPPFDVGSPEKADPKVLESLRNHMQSKFEKCDKD